MSRYLDNLVTEIKAIDTDVVENWEVGNEPEMKVLEEQKVYIWIRIYLKEEDPTIEIGDDVIIKYTPTDEELITKFFYYGKKTMTKDHQEEIVNYDPEDDKKVLCLMVDERVINHGKDIPFIRTMFKVGIHYEYQLVRRNELIFVNKRTGDNLDYFDVDW